MIERVTDREAHMTKHFKLSQSVSEIRCSAVSRRFSTGEKFGKLLSYSLKTDIINNSFCFESIYKP